MHPSIQEAAEKLAFRVFAYDDEGVTLYEAEDANGNVICRDHPTHTHAHEAAVAILAGTCNTLA